MAEYIEREKLPPKKERGFFLDDDFNAGWNACLNKVNSIPAADVVERKTGCWRHYEGELTCSECAVTIYDDIMSLLGDDVPRFCPNCGDEMTGGE